MKLPYLKTLSTKQLLACSAIIILTLLLGLWLTQKPTTTSPEASPEMSPVSSHEKTETPEEDHQTETETIT